MISNIKVYVRVKLPFWATSLLGIVRAINWHRFALWWWEAGWNLISAMHRNRLVNLRRHPTASPMRKILEYTGRVSSRGAAHSSLSPKGSLITI
jgi:hypothetical protein